MLETLGETIDQIPKLYAYFEEEGEYYLVQELIEGQTLGEKTSNEGPVNESACREFLASFLYLLDRVHSRDIIHRDIKPNNVIIRARDGKPVLIDFGIVKEAVSLSLDETGNTRTINFGTPGYAPDEQVRGMPVFASDLYSLGVTTIYFLTGKSPKEMVDPTSGDISWRGHVQSVSPEFAAIIDKSIEPYYRDRYRTARDMLDAINSLAPVESPDETSHQDQAVGEIVEVSSESSTLLMAQAVQEEIIKPYQGQPFVGEPEKVRPQDTPTIPYEQQSQGHQGLAFAEVTLTTNPIPDRPIKRRAGWLIGIGIICIGVLLIVFVINRIPAPTPDDMPSETAPATDRSPEPPAVTASPAVEVLSYYIEVRDADKRVTESVPLDFSRNFRFHFTTRKPGYLYIIGPGKGNTRTIFLTSRPIQDTGMETNKVEAGTEFQFPKTWIDLGTSANLATYTVIFSSHPLWSPDVLASSSIRKLTAADFQQVEALGNRIEPESKGDRFIVRVPATMKDDESKPLVFDIRIKGK